MAWPPKRVAVNERYRTNSDPSWTVFHSFQKPLDINTDTVDSVLLQIITRFTKLTGGVKLGGGVCIAFLPKASFLEQCLDYIKKYRILLVQAHRENVCQLHSSVLTSWKLQGLDTRRDSTCTLLCSHNYFSWKYTQKALADKPIGYIILKQRLYSFRFVQTPCCKLEIIRASIPSK